MDDDWDSNPSQQPFNSNLRSWIRAHGKVFLDPDIDFAPQAITAAASPPLLEESPSEADTAPSPVYSTVYDDYGNRIYVETPSWDPFADPVAYTERIWNSDLLSSMRMAAGRRRRTKRSPTAVSSASSNEGRVFVGRTRSKYASESNIDEAVDMTEPGLRRIPKDTADFTSTEDSATPTPMYSDHIYCSIEENIYEECATPTLERPLPARLLPLEEANESGFFSYQEPYQFYHWDPPIPPLAEEEDEGDQMQHITLIPVKQDSSPTTAAADSYVVTVNGKQFHQQQQQRRPVPKPRRRHLEQRQQTVIPIRAAVPPPEARCDRVLSDRVLMLDSDQISISK